MSVSFVIALVARYPESRRNLYNKLFGSQNTYTINIVQPQIVLSGRGFAVKSWCPSITMGIDHHSSPLSAYRFAFDVFDFFHHAQQISWREVLLESLWTRFCSLWIQSKRKLPQACDLNECFMLLVKSVLWNLRSFSRLQTRRVAGQHAAFHFRSFYRGLLSTMLGSFPSAATFWCVYEVCSVRFM